MIEHILPYFAYCLMVQVESVDGIEILPITAIQRKDGTDIIQVSNTDYYPDADDNEFNIKLILRKMDLQKSIIVDGEELIPIVELAKLAFPEDGDVWIIPKHPKNCVINTNNSDYWFEYDNGFQAGESEDFTDRGILVPRRILNQLCLLKWLFKHKFDVFGHIEKGLAIDVDTLQVNPYNS